MMQPGPAGLWKVIFNSGNEAISSSTAAWLAQLAERRSAEREITGSNPGRTNTQGL